MANQNDLSLANTSLNLIGSDRINSASSGWPFDNPTKSKVVETVNLYLPLAKQETLRARDWNCARARKELAAVTNESLGEWSQAYRLPTDCLCVRRFASDCDEVKLARYSVESDSQDKKILYTSCGTNKIIYTKDLTDVNRWDSLLFNACALRLAWYLAGPIVRDFKLQQSMLQTLAAQFEEACGVDEGEGGIDTPRDRTLVSVRF
jgi:hypothetical protein